jgi:hypothetical protein
LDLWWNIGYLQGPPRDGAYGYVPLNIPPRAPSRTPRLNNIQIYIEIYCYSTTDTKRQCFWRCPAYIAVTFHLVSEAEKHQCFIHKSKYTIHLVQTKICSTMITFFVSMCISFLWISWIAVWQRSGTIVTYAVLLLSIISIIDIYCLYIAMYCLLYKYNCCIYVTAPCWTMIGLINIWIWIWIFIMFSICFNSTSYHH